MNSLTRLESVIAERMGRRYARLVGRGTTALYVALCVIREQAGRGTVILPDLICSTVLDAVLLAGFSPVFADVTPDRFTLDPASVRALITSETRAVINAHLFGHISAIGDFPEAVPPTLNPSPTRREGLPESAACSDSPSLLCGGRGRGMGGGVSLIEDAIQGLGGASGQHGDMTLISFDETKMIGGRGGVLLTDDPALWDMIQRVSLDVTRLPDPPPDESARYRAYRQQLMFTTSALIRPFDESAANVERIAAGWARLAKNVRERNEKAAYLRAALVGMPLTLPEIRTGDAIWRYTFAAPDVLITNWIARHLQNSGLRGTRLYTPLSTLFAPDAHRSQLFSATLAKRLINLWVDHTVSVADLDRVAAIIRAAPYTSVSK